MAFLLDFETEIATIDAEIANLQDNEDGKASDIMSQIKQLQTKRKNKIKKIYGKLSDWQICQIARHPNRPQSGDYINAMIADFVKLAGDRLYAEDEAIITGIGRLAEQTVVVCGHQKGKNTDEKITHNFGMPSPEGYRKVLRMMDLAEKFKLPIINFVDTPGAYPGIGAEERGQSGAIGACLRRSADLKVPIITVIIGEGGSGGALAMSAGDYTAMLEYAIYSVISPEGCASILWKDSSKMADAASCLNLTASKLKKFNLIDEIIPEPLGGAHREPAEAVDNIQQALTKTLQRFLQFDEDKIISRRDERWRNYGAFKSL